MKKKFLYVTMAALVLTGFASCDDDDDNEYVGDKTITIENVTVEKDFVQSGTFQMQGTGQAVIMPDESVTITFNAGKGQALMFASMYGYSNDVFFAPENPGIKLFDSDGKAIVGDVSSQVKLWDNGTRINQVPGSNVTHPGAAQTGTVTMIDGRDAQGNTYLSASDLMQLTLAYTEATSQFTLTIKNRSKGTANETPFSPGVWVVSNKPGGDLVNSEPFFTPGKTSTSILTQLAESGNNKPLGDFVSEKTGIVTNLSPVLVIVYSDATNPIFTLGQKDKGQGLKELAQKGDYGKLKESLENLQSVKKVYVLGSATIAPGEKVESKFESAEGYKVAYVTMFASSNDWFYANSEEISSKATGDLTSKTLLYDSGTGVNQYPGAGNAQALFGGTPSAEDKVIEKVGNTYPVPEVKDIIKISIR